MEAQVSEILENILSMLSLEGSFDVEEKEEAVFVSIETSDAGRLIGHQGETLSALQLLVNQILFKQNQNKISEKRVIIDVSGWREGKEKELAQKAESWAEQVKEEQKPMELEPMPAWQRRVVHMAMQEVEGVKTESVGEGLDRHLVISPGSGESSE